MKFLNLRICAQDYDEKFDAQKFEHFLEIRYYCNIIKNNFPMNSKVVIANKPWIEFGYDNLTNLIEKEEGKNPKIVNGLHQSLFSRYIN